MTKRAEPQIPLKEFYNVLTLVCVGGEYYLLMDKLQEVYRSDSEETAKYVGAELPKCLAEFNKMIIKSTNLNPFSAYEFAKLCRMYKKFRQLWAPNIQF